MNYDLIVYGGGTSGVAAAYIASKYGLNTLLVEKSDSLGGSATRGLVIPCMKVNTLNINTEFFNDLLVFADKYCARTTYCDGNKAWFNPELLKIVLDDMLNSVKCNVLFSSEPESISFDNNLCLFSSYINHKILSIYIESKYIIDATSEGKIFKLLNCDFQLNNDEYQTPTLRFIMSGVNIKSFSEWLIKFDTDRNVTTVDNSGNQIHLSTAYTWDNNRKWALKPLFEKAVSDGILDISDTAYFQIFTIASMPDSVAFNCPRVLPDEDEEDILDPFIYSKALIQARQRIFRLSNFCKKYLIGFENSYISNIADMFGIRESYRIKGQYTLTTDDIINSKKFDNIAFACDYPIDIHSTQKDKDILSFTKDVYYAPVEMLKSANYNNLYGIGRIVSADFKTQSAIRTQLTCFSMGEAASKNIIKELSNQDKKQ